MARDPWRRRSETRSIVSGVAIFSKSAPCWIVQRGSHLGRFHLYERINLQNGCWNNVLDERNAAKPYPGNAPASVDADGAAVAGGGRGGGGGGRGGGGGWGG